MTWATSVPILVFLGLSVLDLGPMYTTDRHQTASSLNAPPIRGGHNNASVNSTVESGQWAWHVCVPDSSASWSGDALG